MSIQQQITSNEADVTSNNDATQPSAFSLVSADSAPQVASNITDGYEQPNIVSRQYFSIESPSVTASSKGKPVQSFTHNISATFKILIVQ